ncbi:MAG: TetR/AcrR family transcriptional regulator [Lapillicoccus sp.]
MVDSVNEHPPRALLLSAGDADEVADLLDARLVSAALEALAGMPAEALSLRKVARGLGVSHQAPYVHFGSKRRFLAAIAGAGLQQAAGDASAAVAAAGSDPRRRLDALGRSYLDFVRTRPHVHDLAYGPMVAKSDHPLLQNAAIAYWSLLRDAVAACQPPGISEPEVLRRSTAAWGTVYGIARLSALHQIPDSVPTDIDGLIHTAIAVLIAGWQAKPPQDSGATTKLSPA